MRRDGLLNNVNGHGKVSIKRCRSRRSARRSHDRLERRPDGSQHDARGVYDALPDEASATRWGPVLTDAAATRECCLRQEASAPTDRSHTPRLDEHRERWLCVSRRLLTQRDAAVSLNRSGPQGERTGRCAHSLEEAVRWRLDVAYMQYRHFDERDLRATPT